MRPVQGIRPAAMFQLSRINLQLYGEETFTGLFHQECQRQVQEKQPPDFRQYSKGKEHHSQPGWNWKRNLCVSVWISINMLKVNLFRTAVVQSLEDEKHIWETWQHGGKGRSASHYSNCDGRIISTQKYGFQSIFSYKTVSHLRP